MRADSSAAVLETVTLDPLPLELVELTELPDLSEATELPEFVGGVEGVGLLEVTEVVVRLGAAETFDSTFNADVLVVATDELVLPVIVTPVNSPGSVPVGYRR